MIVYLILKLSLDQKIKFTREEPNNRLACLDLENSIGEIRKPTNTDQYQQFDFKHPLQHKLDVMRTLEHRVQQVPKINTKKIQQVRKTQGVCDYFGKHGGPTQTERA